MFTDTLIYMDAAYRRYLHPGAGIWHGYEAVCLYKYIYMEVYSMHLMYGRASAWYKYGYIWNISDAQYMKIRLYVDIEYSN